MAKTFKLKTKNNVGVTTSDVYVVPASTTTVVIGVTLANTSGQSINVGVGITRATDDDVNILKTIPLPHGSSIESVSYTHLTLPTNSLV